MVAAIPDHAVQHFLQSQASVSARHLAASLKHPDTLERQEQLQVVQTQQLPSASRPRCLQSA